VCSTHELDASCKTLQQRLIILHKLHTSFGCSNGHRCQVFRPAIHSMPTAKIEIRIGDRLFQADGDQEWVTSQLAIFYSSLETAPPPAKMSAVTPAAAAPLPALSAALGSGATLAAFLKTTNATVSQTRTFLAAAGWLRLRGARTHTTAAVTSALSQNHQGSLGNAAQCLIENIKKGFCERNGKEFYITPAGLKDLGLPEE
jgi:hypothetical protein